MSAQGSAPALTVGPDASLPVRLIQLSDCHLPENPDSTYRSVNADAGLAALVPPVMGWEPDAVLLTGDLSEDASDASYRRIVTLLQPIGRPVLALPGNHDHRETMQRHFPLGPWDGPRVVAAGAWRLVLLDSTVAGRVGGMLADADIRRLQAALRSEPEAPALLALHHQPLNVGSPWIDRYALASPEGLLRLLEANAMIRCVVWGHVHQSFEASCGNARMYACPSTAANSLPRVDSFTPDPAGPAARWLELYPDGTLQTGLLRTRGGTDVSAAAAPARG